MVLCDRVQSELDKAQSFIILVERTLEQNGIPLKDHLSFHTCDSGEFCESSSAPCWLDPHFEDWTIFEIGVIMKRRCLSF